MIDCRTWRSLIFDLRYTLLSHGGKFVLDNKAAASHNTLQHKIIKPSQGKWHIRQSHCKYIYKKSANTAHNRIKKESEGAAAFNPIYWLNGGWNKWALVVVQSAFRHPEPSARGQPLKLWARNACWILWASVSSEFCTVTEDSPGLYAVLRAVLMRCAGLNSSWADRQPYHTQKPSTSFVVA